MLTRHVGDVLGKLDKGVGGGLSCVVSPGGGIYITRPGTACWA